MNIREFSPKDSKSCIAILNKNEEHMGDLYTEDSLIKASSYTSYLVAEEGKDILGMVGLTDLNNGIGMLGTLCVDPEIHGKGVGRALVKATIALAKEKKYRKVLLLTHVKNKPMMILAIQEDFVPEGSLKNHFRDGKDVIYFSYFLT